MLVFCFFGPDFLETSAEVSRGNVETGCRFLHLGDMRAVDHVVYIYACASW